MSNTRQTIKALLDGIEDQIKLINADFNYSDDNLSDIGGDLVAAFDLVGWDLLMKTPRILYYDSLAHIQAFELVADLINTIPDGLVILRTDNASIYFYDKNNSALIEYPPK